MNVKVKICGIRDMGSASVAVAAGADFLGFNFVPTSKRVVSPLVAKGITKAFKGKTVIVGVFQNQSVDEVNAISRELDLDFVQLHGEETEDFCRSITIPVIKSVIHSETFDAIEVARRMSYANIFYYLIDREKRGSGDMVPVTFASELAQSLPLFYAGALTPENVSDVVRRVNPFAVDVAGGIETNGTMDHKKIKTFIVNAKGGDL
jgi:phosphoribosylanthranilate isomerase